MKLYVPLKIHNGLEVFKHKQVTRNKLWYFSRMLILGRMAKASRASAKFPFFCHH